MQFDNIQCNWQFLDSSHKILLGVCLIIFGALGLTLNLWLLATFFKSTLLISRHYLFILAYCIACFARGLVAGFTVSSITAFCQRWLLGDTGCHFFAFFQLVLGVFQVCCLAAIAVERYITIRLYMKGTELCFKIYMIALIICWVLSVLIAICPLLGFGRFYCDMTDTVCDLDWRLIYTKNIPYNLLLIIFFGILPTIVTFTCLILAIIKEKTVLVEKHFTTKTVLIMVFLTYLFWTPKAVLIIFTSFSLKIPKALLVMSAVGAEAATIIPVLTYLVYEATIRKAMIVTLFNSICRNSSNKRQRSFPMKDFRWRSNN